jgi:hypothetical protein
MQNNTISYTVTDVRGKILTTETGINISPDFEKLIDLSLYEDGLYFISIIDANGDTLWSYILKDHSDSIQGTDDLELHRIYEIEGGYFATGFRIPVVALGDEFPYVLSVDTNGCPTYNCHNTIDTIPKDTIINTTFLIYPNPANTLLNILFTTPYNAGNFTFKIYDVSGRLLQTDEHFTPNLPYTVNVSNFANAIYFIEILNGKDRVGRGKFVKQ